MYDFNPFTPLDLVPLPNPLKFIHKEGMSEVKFIKKLHKKVREQIQQQTERYTRKQ